MDFLIHHMLRTSTRVFPEKEALVFGDQRFTYQGVTDHVALVASKLCRAGLEPGDRVGIYLEHSADLVFSLFGISQAGGVFVPINPLLFPRQAFHIINDCRMKALITTHARLSSLSECLKEEHSLKFLIVVDQGKKSSVDLPMYDAEESCPKPSLEETFDGRIENDLAAILYTSGSTGRSKGVLISHAQLMSGTSIVSTYLDISPSDRILSILPFSFDAGLNQLMCAFQMGSTLIMMTFVFAKEILDALEKEEVTGLAGVPTLWSVLTQPRAKLSKRTKLSLRYITNTGGPMPQPVLQSLREGLPQTKIFLMYGLTEAFRSTFLPPEELDRRPTSIGKAIPNTEILVVNDHGQPCKPGEVGELVHRGPTVSLGYWGQPELSDQVLKPHPFLPHEIGSHEKVCYSGDLVKTDEEGYIYFVGRKDTMIKSSGFRISPTEVEEILFQNGTVQAAAVIGVPDPIIGQSVKAFVVPKEGQRFDGEELRGFCSKYLPSYMIPKVIEVLEEMPKTPNGKIDYQQLRQSTEK